jgi:hypothetical protein
VIVGNILYKAMSPNSIESNSRQYSFPSLHGIRAGNNTLALCFFSLPLFAVSIITMANEQSSNGGEVAANPFFFHHSDHPGMVLVSKPLDGENYSTWCRAMTISLNAKSKLGFIDGTTTMPSATAKPDDYAAWKKCNDMILSWILNSLTQDLADSVIFSTTAQEVWEDLRDRFSQSNAPRIFQIERDIACLAQDQLTVAAYYTRLKKLWDELGSYNDTVCSCGADHKRRRLMQFLMGLNESYSAIQSRLLIIHMSKRQIFYSFVDIC